MLRFFKSNVDGVPKPSRFTFPFNYTPDTLTQIAAQELQSELVNHQLVQESLDLGYGKMFGVLVVEGDEGLGYLAAFSGKLVHTNIVDGFVPPIYDRLTNEGFFLKGEADLVRLTADIKTLEASSKKKELQRQLDECKNSFERELQKLKTRIKESKLERKAKRLEIDQLPEAQRVEVQKQMTIQSMDESRSLKRFKKAGIQEIEMLEVKLAQLELEIVDLKKRRKQLSGLLQEKLFAEYKFLNADGERQNLLDVFEFTALKIPPAGAGDCCAPKLLQYAYANKLRPISMAEFWWGPSPKMEVRKQGEYYPACKSKCAPILGHMLKGLEVDPNPISSIDTSKLSVQLIYEDDYLAVVNKPAGLLSVPGKEVEDCVAQRMKSLFPNSTGPLVAHRLDMSTSGIMLIGKTLEVYKVLQRMFTKREIEKRYQAVLEGIPHTKQGFIDLSLRVDLDNRPMQLVDPEFGKPSRTRFEVIEEYAHESRVYFYPITGRTHQLRVHASHPDGLNCPIKGDELYGRAATRLHLHADWIQFKHPVNRELLTFTSSPDF